ncbi:hypothetical protein GJ496_001109 [Pomphorhynchus laevis]|nr:hypothetical protein GJ496_001109 [Pomphorhynchus laevis]
MVNLILHNIMVKDVDDQSHTQFTDKSTIAHSILKHIQTILDLKDQNIKNFVLDCDFKNLGQSDEYTSIFRICCEVIKSHLIAEESVLVIGYSQILNDLRKWIEHTDNELHTYPGVPFVYELSEELNILKRYMVATLEHQRLLSISVATNESFISNVSTTEADGHFCYTLCDLIGSGATAHVYSAIDINKNRKVAIKFATASPVEFLNEIAVLKDISDDNEYSPKCFWTGQIKGYNAIILELLSADLQYFYENVYLKEAFSFKWIVDHAIQIVNCLKWFHSKGYVHCSVKPQNFAFRINHGINWRICMIDFGKSQKYLRNDGSHILKPIKKLSPKCSRYGSLNVLLGELDSRRDDMESLAYIIIDFFNNGLPWSGYDSTNANTSLNFEKLKELKSQSASQLCKNMPCAFTDYLNYCRSLQFEEDPDYDKITRMLLDTN